MIAFAVLGELRQLLPCMSPVLALPRRYLAARVVGLRTGLRRADDALNTVLNVIERSFPDRC